MVDLLLIPVESVYNQLHQSTSLSQKVVSRMPNTCRSTTAHVILSARDPFLWPPRALFVAAADA